MTLNFLTPLFASPAVSHIATAIVTGYVGYLFGQQKELTKKKHDKAAEDAAFRAIELEMPDLIAEMREDFACPENSAVREFFVYEKGVTISSSSQARFHYSRDDGRKLRAQVAILENVGYAKVVRDDGVAPWFRMSEDFVRRLKKKG